MSNVVTRGVTEYRRRAFIGLIAQAPATGGDPLEQWASHAPLWEVFSGRTDLLRALQEHWTDLLSHRVYGAPRYPLGPEGLRATYAELAATHPALRAVLDRHADDAELADLRLAEEVLVARAAGNLDTRASISTLAWRARDLIASVPAQREAPLVAALEE
ncbi:MAG TPA: hypothetical protein VFK41_04290 [Nocardioidaceae bacterium]|nr:hypothetical protein [Nocardioidaceae bacterium]